METTENKPEQKTNEGITVLNQVQSTGGIPSWLKTFNSFTIIVVGVILALGINSGKILESYVNSRVANQTTEQATNGEIQKNSLAALIDLSNGLNQHVFDLTTSVNVLIEENKKLTENNIELNKNITKLQENIAALQLDNERLKTEVAALKTQISELQKSK